MEIALTADVHLKQDPDNSPARYSALENILSRMENKGLSTLIIAGDLFDKECRNYSHFEQICADYPQIDLYVIAGNHDAGLSSEQFKAENLQVFSQPEIISINGAELSFFLLPYQPDTSMGEVIADYERQLPDSWLLVSHGDYLGGQRLDGSYETGTYMPVNKNDLQRFGPELALLGHIHQRQTIDRVHYPGSPQGLHINETGPRFFSIIDTQTLSVEAQRVDTETIYYNEHITALPVADEPEYIKEQVKQMQDSWELTADEYDKVRLRLTVGGFTQNIEKLQAALTEALPADLSFYEAEGPDLSAVQILHNQERARIVKAVKEHIESKADLLREKNLKVQSVMQEAMEIIFA